MELLLEADPELHGSYLLYWTLTADHARERIKVLQESILSFQRVVETRHQEVPEEVDGSTPSSEHYLPTRSNKTIVTDEIYRSFIDQMEKAKKDLHVAQARIFRINQNLKKIGE
ncbi:hypothetical protein [Sicyoidochytrium minutum DNA virus]|nr:hypothetical protein [Sicyoidochytrium minutum DNA virus]BDC16756.1 hypothetical protein [Sicyoidochytrium minutum DNA virus]